MERTLVDFKTAYIGLGSNLGDRLAHLRRATGLLGTYMTVAATSPVYETEPVGHAAQGWFLNCVAAVQTERSPLDLLAAVREVETTMGKATPFPNGPRIIDIDLLLYGNAAVDTATLRVPHPRMHERRFVLAPLADIAPDAVHPVLGVAVAGLLARLPEGEQVRRYADSLG